MKIRYQSALAWTLAIFAGLLVISSGIAKLVGIPAVVEGLSKLGVGPYITFLGIMEIVFSILFLFPKTAKIGFLLVTCYFAGALATDLSHGSPNMTPFIILVMVWVATYLRSPEIFVNQKATVQPNRI